MSELIFKKLFEVKVLHDYYLMARDGISFFNRPVDEQEELITKKIKANQYPVWDDLEFRPSLLMQNVMSLYKLHFMQTATGFIVGVMVDREKPNANTLLYKPVISIPNDVNLLFDMKIKNRLFSTFTSTKLSRELPAIYYFHNTDKSTADSTLPIAADMRVANGDLRYEMGETVYISGVPNEAIQETTIIGNTVSAADWAATDDRRFVNESDRTLLPHKFIYQVPSADQTVTDLEFILEDGGTPVKTISRTDADGILSTSLDFTKEDDADIDSMEIPAGFYTLEVVSNGVQTFEYPVFISDFYHRDLFGVINIRMDAADEDYQIIDSNGYLKTRTDNGIFISHPVFELRFRSRKTFWRYIDNQGFDAGQVTAAPVADFLDPDDPANPKVLISKNPKRLAATLQYFMNGTNLLLPNPPLRPLRKSDGRFYSDIYIGKENRLLNN